MILAFLVSSGAFAIGALGMLLSNVAADRQTRRGRWIKFATYLIVVYLVIFAATRGSLALAGLFAVIVLICAWELVRAALTNGGSASSAFLFLSVYTPLAVGLLVFVGRSRPETAVYVFLVVAAFDGFSQVCGQLLGRRPLVGALSPGKTVEGLLGGLAVAAAVGAGLRTLVPLDLSTSLAFATAMAGAGLAGDLLASWAKRQRDLKDFGQLLPGHGGVLDRFDSFVMAAPTALVLERFLS